MRCKGLIAMVVVASWLLPAAGAAAAAPATQAKSAKTKVTVSKRWRGYGFLPGYRPQLAESQGTPVYGKPLPAANGATSITTATSITAGALRASIAAAGTAAASGRAGRPRRSA